MTWKAPEINRPGGPQTGPERPILEAMLNWHRATLLWKCAGLTGEQLAERAIPPSGLSLLALIRHLTKVERVWFRIRFAGEPVESPFPDVEAEFEDVDPARAAADYARLTEEFRLADAAAANASLDDEFNDRDGEPMSLRMLYLHMIEEYARHIGHADLLRERIDGATGELPHSHHAADTYSWPGAGLGSAENEPSAIRPNAKAWTRMYRPVASADSTEQGPAAASLASAAFWNVAVCERSTRTSRPSAADSSTTRAVAVSFRPAEHEVASI